MDVLSSVISVLALCVSGAAYWNAKKVRNNSESLERIQYAPRVAASVTLQLPPNGHSLSGELRISNPGEKHITLLEVSLSGDALANVGSGYRVLTSNLILNGSTTIKSGDAIDLPFKVVVGVGTLQTLNLDVYIAGADAKQKDFRGILVLGNCV